MLRFVATGCLLGLAAWLPAQDTAPGLSVRFESLIEAPPLAMRSDSRVARGLALMVPRGEAPTPFMAPGVFRAEWCGTLLTEKRDRYSFAFTGRGRFELSIDGVTLLTSDGGKAETVASEALRLKQGSHALLVNYQSTLSGRASMRIEWECRAFAREPIRIEALRHNPTEQELVSATQRRRGRELFAERRCISCHEIKLGETAMRDLRIGAPALEGIGDRLEPAWMAAMIADPHAQRGTARMPRMLQGSPEEVAQQAADLAVYLADHSLGQEHEPTKGNSTEGGMLFAELGCIACHEFATDPAPPTISLGNVGAKFRPGMLAAFLLDPGQHDPWTRMPDFRLNEIEASDLAAFLRKHSASAGTVPAGDSGRGAGLAGKSGCVHCHQPEMDFVYTAPKLATILAGNIEAGCLATEAVARGRAPDFGFDSEERAALQAFAETGMHALARHSRTEFAARQIRERRCTACHSYDGAADLWTERAHLLADLEIEERPRPDPDVSQFRPNLSYLGARLQVPWMESFLKGEMASPRPWMRARMPTFSKIAAEMALGLAAQHGLGVEIEPHGLSASLVVEGRKLVSAAGGFACNACHAIGEQKATSVFEVEGVNFALSAERLRHGYFLRWMLDPPRIEPASKMPKFADDRGQTAFREILGGDARRQFQAIWVYLESLR